MSVRVNEVIGVAGFVLPGTRVDVLATVNAPAQDIGEQLEGGGGTVDAPLIGALR